MFTIMLFSSGDYTLKSRRTKSRAIALMVYLAWSLQSGSVRWFTDRQSSS
jgi:hypothetical protein